VRASGWKIRPSVVGAWEHYETTPVETSSCWAARMPEYSPACIPDITAKVGPGELPVMRATGISTRSPLRRTRSATVVVNPGLRSFIGQLLSGRILAVGGPERSSHWTKSLATDT